MGGSIEWNKPGTVLLRLPPSQSLHVEDRTDTVQRLAMTADCRSSSRERPERGALTGKVMQTGHSRFSFSQERGTGGTARDGTRFQPILNKERSGQHTVTFRLQKAVVFKGQLYE